MRYPKSLKRKGNTSQTGKIVEGRYANYFAVGYNACEIIFDFGQLYNENDQAELCSRFITNPIYAKAFLRTLKETVDQYETEFGEIQED